MPVFIEEVVRLEPPAPLTPRVATQDTEIAGVPIPQGAYITTCVASANRDPSEYPDADELHIDDQARRHWGFGGGPHRCLGMHLARLEVKLVLEAWHARVTDYEVAPGFTPEIAWPAPTFYLKSLPLVLRPSAPGLG